MSKKLELEEIFHHGNVYAYKSMVLGDYVVCHSYINGNGEGGEPANIKHTYRFIKRADAMRRYKAIVKQMKTEDV